jgi:hypothetical protein
MEEYSERFDDYFSTKGLIGESKSKMSSLEKEAWNDGPGWTDGGWIDGNDWENSDWSNGYHTKS